MNRPLPVPNCYSGIRTNEYGGLTAATVRRDHPTLGALFHTESSGRSPGGGTAMIRDRELGDRHRSTTSR